MKVILQKNVIGLGDLGEIKKVSDGYARNYLIPRKLAISAHAGSTKAIEHQKRILINKARKRKEMAEDLAKKFQDLNDIEIEARVGTEEQLFGSVTNSHVANYFKGLGFEIDRRKIELKTSIRTLGKHSITINFMEGKRVELSVNIVPDEVSRKKAEALRVKAERKARKEKIEQDLKEEMANKETKGE